MKSLFLRSSLYSLLLLLSACAEPINVGAPAPPAPAPAPAAPVRGSLAVAALLGKDEEPKHLDGVYGLLLFPRMLQSNKGALENICRAFFSSFQPSIIPSQSPNGAVRPTFWLDSRDAKALPSTSTCTNLLENDDYNGAQRWLNSLDMADVRGPVLVAYNERKNQSVRLDLSGIDDQGDINFAMRKWNSIITQDAENWSSQWADQLAVEIRIVLTNATPALMSVWSLTRAEAKSNPVGSEEFSHGKLIGPRSNIIEFEKI